MAHLGILKMVEEIKQKKTEEKKIIKIVFRLRATSRTYTMKTAKIKLFRLKLYLLWLKIAFIHDTLVRHSSQFIRENLWRSHTFALHSCKCEKANGSKNACRNYFILFFLAIFIRQSCCFESLNKKNRISNIYRQRLPIKLCNSTHSHYRNLFFFFSCTQCNNSHYYR